MQAEIVAQPSGSALRKEDIGYSTHASGDFNIRVPYQKINKDGDYEVKVYLINGSSVSYRFNVKDLGDVKEIELTYDAASYSAGSLVKGAWVALKDFDDYSLGKSYENWKIDNLFSLSISDASFMDGMMETNTGRFKLRDDRSGVITMTVVDRNLNLVGDAKLNIEKVASYLKLTPRSIGAINTEVVVDIELVDVDGKLAATGIRANSANDASRAAIISKPDGAVASASRLDLSSFANGKASVRVNSDKEGDVFLQVIIKETVGKLPGVAWASVPDTRNKQMTDFNGNLLYWNTAVVSPSALYEYQRTEPLYNDATNGFSIGNLDIGPTDELTTASNSYPVYQTKRLRAGNGDELFWADSSLTTTTAIGPAYKEAYEIIQETYYKSGENNYDALSTADKYGGRTYTGAATISFGATAGGGTLIFIIGAPSFVASNKAFVAESPAFIEGSRTYLGVRDIGTAMGATVDWDQDTQTATLAKNNVVVKVTVGADSISESRNGVTKQTAIDAPALNKAGRVYLPARALLEAFGYKVDWNDDTQAVVCSL
jgi:hypothetical protein